MQLALSNPTSVAAPVPNPGGRGGRHVLVCPTDGRVYYGPYERAFEVERAKACYVIGTPRALEASLVLLDDFLQMVVYHIDAHLGVVNAYTPDGKGFVDLHWFSQIVVGVCCTDVSYARADAEILMRVMMNARVLAGTATALVEQGNDRDGRGDFCFVSTLQCADYTLNRICIAADYVRDYIDRIRWRAMVAYPGPKLRAFLNDALADEVTRKSFHEGSLFPTR
jgi:hypothetical protein